MSDYRKYPPEPPSSKHMTAGILIVAAVLIGAILDRLMS